MVAQLEFHRSARIPAEVQEWVNLVRKKAPAYSERVYAYLDSELPLDRKILLGLTSHDSRWQLPAFAQLVLEFGTGHCTRPLRPAHTVPELEKIWNKVDIARHLVMQLRRRSIVAFRHKLCAHARRQLVVLLSSSEPRHIYPGNVATQARYTTGSPCGQCLTYKDLACILPTAAEEHHIVDLVWKSGS